MPEIAATFDGSSSAKSRAEFDRLCAAYVDMAYGAAFRQTGDAHVAADVTQAVFVVLARRWDAGGGGLPQEERMAGWLLKAVSYGVKGVRRVAVRRGYHERRAAEMREEANGPEVADGGPILRMVDQMLLKLGTRDQELVARRYLHGETLAEIATALRMKENTAGRRTARALEKLRKLLVQHGVVVPATALSTALLNQATRQAPAAVISAATGATGAGMSGPAGMLAKVIVKGFVMAKISTALAATAGVLLAATAGIITWQAAAAKQGEPTATAATAATTTGATRRDFVPRIVTEQPSESLLRNVGRQIIQKRQALTSLRIEAATTLEMLVPETGEWKMIGRCEGTAWVEPLHELGAEVNVPLKMHVEAERWLGSARPGLGWAYRTALDEAGVALPLQYDPSDVGLGDNLKAGSLVETLDAMNTMRVWGPPIMGPNVDPRTWAPGGGEGGAKIAAVSLSSSKGKDFAGSAIAGEMFSTQLMDQAWWGEPLGTFAFGPAGGRPPTKPEFTARRVLLNETEATELQVKHALGDAADPRTVVSTFWFHGGRGFSLMGMKAEWDRGGPSLKVEVDQTEEIAPGIFYPTAGHGEYRANDGKKEHGDTLRWTFAAKRAEANAPIPAGMMSVEFVVPPKKFADTNWGGRGGEGSQPATSARPRRLAKARN